MAEIVNVRFRTDALEYVDKMAADTGLSRARVIELIVLMARDAGWQVLRIRQTESPLSDQEYGQ